MAPSTDRLRSLADHSKGTEQMIGFAIGALIQCIALVERMLARLLFKSTAEVGGCPRFFVLLPLTTAANAAK
jgi:hypothetical protein